ncbi:MAG: hypothetical protein WA117_25780 [Verrucomicrobiia bacterium]
MKKSTADSGVICFTTGLWGTALIRASQDSIGNSTPCSRTHRINSPITPIMAALAKTTHRAGLDAGHPARKKRAALSRTINHAVNGAITRYSGPDMEQGGRPGIQQMAHANAMLPLAVAQKSASRRAQVVECVSDRTVTDASLIYTFAQQLSVLGFSHIKHIA